MKKNYVKPSCCLEEIELTNIILASGEFGKKDPYEVESDWIWGDIFE